MTTQNLPQSGPGASHAESVRAAAERYVNEGWRIVPIPLGEKSPNEKGWPDRDYEPEDISGNVGVILGPVSRNLIDVDLDSHWSMRLASHFLPKTATFGHKSKPASHWLYYCEGLRSRNFTFPASAAVSASSPKAQEQIELRAQNASSDKCSKQSVFPGSIWTNKRDPSQTEPVEWDDDAPDEITSIERGDLVWRVTRLTVACMIADGWQEGTQRNNKTLCLAGGLLQSKWTPDEVFELFEAVFDVTDVDVEQREKDLGAVERTIAAFEAGTNVSGFGALINDGLLDPAVVRRIEHHCRTPDTLAVELKMAGTAAGQRTRERLIREAQDTDRLGAVADGVALLTQGGEPPSSLAANDTGNEGLDLFASLGDDPGLDAACEELDWLIEGLQIAPGKVTLLTAFAGGGKTPMAALMSVCVAAGVDCLGHKVKRAKVLYLATEGGRNTRRKIIRIALGLGLDARQLEANGWLKILDAKALDDDSPARLESVVRAHEIGMVVIDTITSALRDSSVGRNEAEYAHTLWELGPMSERTRCVVLGLAHDNKSASGADLRGTSGSSAIVEAAATVVRLEPSPDDDKLLKVSCARAPDERFQAFGVRWVDGSGSIGEAARASVAGGVSVPLRCKLDDGAMADRRGSSALNTERANEKTRSMRTAAPRVLDTLKGPGNGDMKQLTAAAGDVSKRVLSEVLVRLRRERAVIVAGPFYSLTAEWRRDWPTPALRARVDASMARTARDADATD